MSLGFEVGLGELSISSGNRVLSILAASLLGHLCLSLVVAISHVGILLRHALMVQPLQVLKVSLLLRGQELRLARVGHARCVLKRRHSLEHAYARVLSTVHTITAAGTTSVGKLFVALLLLVLVLLVLLGEVVLGGTIGVSRTRVHHLHLADRRLLFDARALLIFHQPLIVILYNGRIRCRSGSVGGSRNKTAFLAVEVLLDDSPLAGSTSLSSSSASAQVVRELLGGSLVGIIVILALFIILSGGSKSLALSWAAGRVDLKTILLLNLTEANLLDIVKQSIYNQA